MDREFSRRLSLPRRSPRLVALPHVNSHGLLRWLTVLKVARILLSRAAALGHTANIPLRQNAAPAAAWIGRRAGWSARERITVRIAAVPAERCSVRAPAGLGGVVGVAVLRCLLAAAEQRETVALAVRGLRCRGLRRDQRVVPGVRHVEGDGVP